MSAHARLVRCCGCPPTPSTCIQASNYCPEYLSVSLPPLTLVRKAWTTQTSSPLEHSWLSSVVPGQYQGCFAPCSNWPFPNNPNRGHAPFNTLVYDWQATYRADGITFRRTTALNDPCGRWCIVRGSGQQGTMSFQSVFQEAKLIYQQQCGGPMPYGMRVRTAPYLQTSLSSRPMSEQNEYVGKLESITMPGGACKWRLTMRMGIWDHPVQMSGVNTPGDYCVGTGGTGGPATCYQFPPTSMEWNIDLIQEWLGGLPQTIPCPGTGQVVLARFYTGGSFVDLLNPADGTWDGNTCNGTGNQFSSSWSASCIVAYGGGVPLCGLRTSSGSPATIVGA